LAFGSGGVYGRFSLCRWGLDRAKQMSAFPNESFRFSNDHRGSGWALAAGNVFFLKEGTRFGRQELVIAVDWVGGYRLNFAKRLGAYHRLMRERFEGGRCMICARF